MITCPKCQFVQPEDIYCANCGVNMQNFKSKPAPVWKVLVDSWMAKLGLMIIVIVAFVIYDGQKDRKSAKNVAASTRQNVRPEYKPSAATDSSEYESQSVKPPPADTAAAEPARPPARKMPVAD